MILSGFLVAFSMFFSAIIFAESFKKSGRIYIALGSNLVGAMAGSVCEYFSRIYGLKSLYILAAVMYVFAWITVRPVAEKQTFARPYKSNS